jgi:hypothetical protein
MHGTTMKIRIRSYKAEQDRDYVTDRSDLVVSFVLRINTAVPVA